MEVAGAAQIAVLDDGGGFGGGPGRCRGLPDGNGGDSAVGERADLEGAGGDGFGLGRPEIAEQPQHAETGSEAVLGMRPVGQDGDDQSSVLGPTVAAQRRSRSGLQSA